MDFSELVKRRRSTRNFATQPVPRRLIGQCLEAARLAPSASNSQPWSFIVVDDPELKEKLAGKAFSGVYRINAFARSAPVLVAVVTERSRYIARLGGMLRGVRFSLIDIGIAGEHLALQAAELGIGTCWLGWFDRKAVRRVLGLPRRTRIDVMFALGFASDEGAAREKMRKTLAEIARYNHE